MRLTFIFLLLILVSNRSYAQNLILKGKIVDSKGIPVPFASVYERNTTSGTSANSDGEFQLKLNAREAFNDFQGDWFQPGIKRAGLKI